MAPAYDELRILLTAYVQSWGGELSISKIKACLQLVSTEQVCHLLTTVENVFGYTAIHIAAINDHPEVITSLLDSLTAEQKYQLLMISGVFRKTPLHLAASAGRTVAAMCICNLVTTEQRYHLLTIQTVSGCTPLHFAARKGHIQIITHILDSVEPAQQIQLLDITDSYNRTVLESALQKNNQSTADLIKQYRSKAVIQRQKNPAHGKNSYYG